MISDYKIGLVLKQGFKRQIRNMLYFLEHEVKRLVRVRIGNLSITGLAEGAWRELTAVEVDKLLVHPQAKDRPKLSKPKKVSQLRGFFVNATQIVGEQERLKRVGKKGKRKAKPLARREAASAGTPLLGPEAERREHQQ
jgi:hypothetical protein